MAVETDFEAMVVAGAADVGNGKLHAVETTDIQQQRIRVEHDRHRVGLSAVGGDNGAYLHGGRGIGAPVDRIDGHAVAIAN